MSGNVWEWCWDRYDDYPINELTDYPGAVLGSYRVFRGSGWDIDASYCPVAIRLGRSPTNWHVGVGFRFACP